MAERRKSTKKVPENRKKYRKCGRKPENAMSESRKDEKKICGKPEKAYCFCGKPETDPPFLALNIDAGGWSSHGWPSELI